jgi:FtsZ-interacting cell division protein ZipA
VTDFIVDNLGVLLRSTYVIVSVGVLIVLIAIAGHQSGGTTSLTAGSSPAATQAAPAHTYDAPEKKAPRAVTTTSAPAPQTQAPRQTQAAQQTQQQQQQQQQQTQQQAQAPQTQAPRQTQAAQPTCYPISDEGTCYEPGEYCRDDDHGTSGVAGDGEAITCEDNDGWRWEPS